MTFTLTPELIKQLQPRAKPFYAYDELITGLAVRVAVNGGKTWSVRYRFGPFERRVRLGKCPTLSLADARAAAKAKLKLVSKDIDPAVVKVERREADSVADFAKIYIEKHAKPHKKSWKTDQRYLTHEVLPAWTHRPMKEITHRDVRELLNRIAKRGAPIVANRVLSLLHKLFNVAIEEDVVTANPVAATRRPGKEQQRDRVLTHEEIRTFWTATEALPLEMQSAFRLRLLTAQRGGEVFNMRWADLDLDQAWWTIPASASKNGLPHRVPLSTPVINMLKTLRVQVDAHLKTQKDPKPPVFVLAGARGKRQQAEAVATFKIADFHGHDLRRTAASLMTGSGTPRLVVSKILNHKESGVTAVYDRHSYDNEKRIALDAWARTLASLIENTPGASVVPFQRQA